MTIVTEIYSVAGTATWFGEKKGPKEFHKNVEKYLCAEDRF